MIAVPIIKAIAFPWILVDQNDKVIDSGSGSLFSQPETTIDNVLPALRTLQCNGWARCSAGFAVYKFTTGAVAPFNVILYGMKINGISTAQGRSTGLSVKMDPESLVKYVADYCEGVEALDDSYRMLIRENIHEIRGINSGLYNTAYQLEKLLEAGDTTFQPDKIAKSVVRWSELLSGRIDFMEFIANPETLNITKTDIPVYKKFDKIQRCFRVTASREEIRISMEGSSNGTVYGPPIFDIVPYLLLDNAVKYSPPGKNVTVLCNESNNFIFCKVTSIGPHINEDELATIFDSTVRGRNAVRSGKGGSGFGLPVLSRIVKTVFNGSIVVTQVPTYLQVNGIPYSEVSFEVKLPIGRRSGGWQ